VWHMALAPQSGAPAFKERDGDTSADHFVHVSNP